MRGRTQCHRGWYYLVYVARQVSHPADIFIEPCDLTLTKIRAEQTAISLGNDDFCRKNPGFSSVYSPGEVTCYWIRRNRRTLKETCHQIT